MDNHLQVNTYFEFNYLITLTVMLTSEQQQGAPGADPGGGGVMTPPALDHQFFFSTNFLTICGWRHMGNVQGGVCL